MVLAQNRPLEQWNRMKSLEISPHSYGQFTYNKGAKNIQWGKDNHFYKWFWGNWTAIWKRMKRDHFLTP